VFTFAAMLKPGDPAADLELPDEQGRPVRLSDRWKERVLVLFFYPKDNTPGCTAEACGFRDAYDELSANGAEIIGISGDDAASHQGFIRRFQLPFTLLSDRDGRARKAFDVGRTLGLWPGRVTYVIDREGTVRAAFSHAFQPTRHVQDALEAVIAQRSS